MDLFETMGGTVGGQKARVSHFLLALSLRMLVLHSDYRALMCDYFLMARGDFLRCSLLANQTGYSHILYYRHNVLMLDATLR